MATLQDIAQEANVSPSAVSMVLNGRPGISPGTRDRVEAAIRKLNYRPAGAGRPLKRGQVYNLAIVYDQWVVHDGHVHPLAASWISSIRRVAMDAGHHVSIFVGAGSEADGIFQRILTDSELHGAVLIGTGANDAYFQALAASQLPVVVMNRRPKHDEFSYVAMDNYGAGRSVVEHFHALGHRRIAHLRDSLDLAFRVDRSEGFADALAARGLEPACTERLDGHVTPEAVERVCRSIKQTGATAVFVDAVVETTACLDAWGRMGVSVPKQLSVIDFDDMGWRSQAGLRPTSVGFDREFMGAAAAQLLLELLADSGKIRRRSLIVPTHIVEHDTTGPVGR